MKNPIFYTLKFLLYAFFQVLFLKDVTVFGYAHNFFYLAALLILPLEMTAIPTMLICFVMGIFVDSFYDTGGIHTAGAVLLGFIRPYLLNSLKPIGGYETTAEATAESMGLRWFFSYASVLIFAHHFVVFGLESFSFQLFLSAFFKLTASFIFTLLSIYGFQAAFNRFM
jgi:hypothetical protein